VPMSETQKLEIAVSNVTLTRPLDAGALYSGFVKAVAP